MLWLLFPLLALFLLIILAAVPLQAFVGYAVVIAWISFMLYVIFYRGEPVSEAIQKLDAKRGKEVRSM